MNEALLAALDEEHTALEAFASLLAVEARALAAVSPLDTLPTLVEQKQQLITRLAALEQRRDAALTALGLPGGKAGMARAIEQEKLRAGPAEARLAGRWRQLRQTVERARQANANNGLMIRVRMDYNARALAALRAVPASSGFYGPDGRVSALA
jgi:flagellar biosynthesis protein FlgN